ncbi:MAG: transcriptional repressor LexA [Chlamydiales bacterium]
MFGLTKRQKDILHFIFHFIDTHGYSPSYRDISTHFGFHSLGTVYNHIKILKRKGALLNEIKGARSLSMPSSLKQGHDEENVNVPFLGYLEEGKPIETIPTAQTTALPRSLVTNPSHSYALRVRGNSLSSEMMSDGDLILVETNPSPKSGEMILGMLHQSKTVVKQYFNEGNKICLISKDHSKDPLIVREQDFHLVGKVCGLIRCFD